MRKPTEIGGFMDGKWSKLLATFLTTFFDHFLFLFGKMGEMGYSASFAAWIMVCARYMMRPISTGLTSFSPCSFR